MAKRNWKEWLSKNVWNNINLPEDYLVVKLLPECGRDNDNFPCYCVVIDSNSSVADRWSWPEEWQTGDLIFVDLGQALNIPIPRTGKFYIVHQDNILAYFGQEEEEEEEEKEELW